MSTCADAPSAPGSHAPTRDLALFYGSRLLSQAGQAVFIGALLIAAGTADNGPLGLSGVFAATLAGAVCCGLPGGALADRLGPGRGFVLGAVLRLLTILSALLVGAGTPWVWCVAFAYSAGSQVFSPAEMALVHTLQRHALGRAHLLLVGLQYAAQGVGVVALGFVLVLDGVQLAALVAAVCYGGVTILAAALALGLRRRHDAAPATRERTLAFGETFRFILREHRAAYAIGVLAFTDLALRSTVIVVPRYLADGLDLGSGQVIAVLAVGIVGVAGGLVWTLRSFALGDAHRVMRLALVGMVGTVALLASLAPLAEGLDLSTWLILLPLMVGALALGLSFCVAPIASRAILSATAPAEHQGRVFATQATLAHAAVVPPVLLAGLGTQYAGAQPTLLLLLGAGLGLALALEAIAGRFRLTAAPVNQTAS